MPPVIMQPASRAEAAARSISRYWILLPDPGKLLITRDMDNSSLKPPAQTVGYLCLCASNTMALSTPTSEHTLAEHITQNIHGAAQLAPPAPLRANWELDQEAVIT